MALEAVTREPRASPPSPSRGRGGWAVCRCARWQFWNSVETTSVLHRSRVVLQLVPRVVAP
eukprot:6827690-Prymnesium_polylepis.1